MAQRRHVGLQIDTRPAQRSLFAQTDVTWVKGDRGRRSSIGVALDASLAQFSHLRSAKRSTGTGETSFRAVAEAVAKELVRQRHRSTGRSSSNNLLRTGSGTIAAALGAGGGAAAAAAAAAGGGGAGSSTGSDTGSRRASLVPPAGGRETPTSQRTPSFHPQLGDVDFSWEQLQDMVRVSAVVIGTGPTSRAVVNHLNDYVSQLAALGQTASDFVPNFFTVHVAATVGDGLTLVEKTDAVRLVVIEMSADLLLTGGAALAHFLKDLRTRFPEVSVVMVACDSHDSHDGKQGLSQTTDNVLKVVGPTAWTTWNKEAAVQHQQLQRTVQLLRKRMVALRWKLSLLEKERAKTAELSEMVEELERKLQRGKQYPIAERARQWDHSVTKMNKMLASPLTTQITPQSLSPSLRPRAEPAPLNPSSSIVLVRHWREFLYGQCAPDASERSDTGSAGDEAEQLALPLDDPRRHRVIWTPLHLVLHTLSSIQTPDNRLALAAVINALSSGRLTEPLWGPYFERHHVDKTTKAWLRITFGVDDGPSSSPTPASNGKDDEEDDDGGDGGGADDDDDGALGEMVLPLIAVTLLPKDDAALDGFEFDVFKYSPAQLPDVAMAILERLQITAMIPQSSQRHLGAFVSVMLQKAGRVPFSNAYHAVDTLQATAVLLRHFGAQLLPEELLAAVVVAVSYVAGHQGLDSEYHARARTALWGAYNRHRPVQNRSLHLASEVLAQVDYALCDELDEGQRDGFFSSLAFAIHTSCDDHRHWKLMAFLQVNTDLEARADVLESPEARRTLLATLLRAAMHAFLVRPPPVADVWMQRYAQQKLWQGLNEDRHNLSVGPFCRPGEPVRRPRLALALVDYIASPVYLNLNTLARPCAQLYQACQNLSQNRAGWAHAVVQYVESVKAGGRPAPAPPAPPREEGLTLPPLVSSSSRDATPRQPRPPPGHGPGRHRPAPIAA